MYIQLKQDWGAKYNIMFTTEQYVSGNTRIAMHYYDEDCEQYLPFASLTVNLVGEHCDEDCGFIDTNNLGNNIIQWLIDNNLAMQTGRFGKSGFCVYPEVKFNMDEVKKYVR